MLKKMDYFCFLTILSTVCMSQFYFYLSTNVINSKYLLLPLQYFLLIESATRSNLSSYLDF